MKYRYYKIFIFLLYSVIVVSCSLNIKTPDEYSARLDYDHYNSVSFFAIDDINIANYEYLSYIEEQILYKIPYGNRKITVHMNKLLYSSNLFRKSFDEYITFNVYLNPETTYSLKSETTSDEIEIWIVDSDENLISNKITKQIIQNEFPVHFPGVNYINYY